MKHVTPNKETIRRICSIFHVEECWLRITTDNEKNRLFISLDKDKIASFNQELKDWSGIDFEIISLHNNIKDQVIKPEGVQLLPLQKNIALRDINMRRKRRR